MPRKLRRRVLNGVSRSAEEHAVATGLRTSLAAAGLLLAGLGLPCAASGEAVPEAPFEGSTPARVEAASAPAPAPSERPPAAGVLADPVTTRVATAPGLLAAEAAARSALAAPLEPGTPGDAFGEGHALGEVHASGEGDAPAEEELSAEETATLEAALAEIQQTRPEPVRSALTDLEHRAALVARTAPRARSYAGLLPANLRRAAAVRLGRVLERTTGYDDAAAAYAHAIAFGLQEPSAWRGLARSRLRSGDLEGAEGAFLAALDLAQSRKALGQEARSLAELAELYLVVDRPDEAVTALEWATAMQPGQARWDALLARARYESDPQRYDVPELVVPLWPPTAGARWLAEVEARLDRVVAAAPAPVQRALAWALTPAGLRIGGLLALGLAVLWLAVRLTRGTGHLVVSIEFPPELRGTFTVRIAGRPGQFKRTPRAERAIGPRAQASTKTCHHMVSRETLFTGLEPGTYHVCVEGVLQDPASGEVLLDPFEEQAAQVARNATMRCDFDLSPQDSPVDVSVSWDKRPAEDAGVTARGMHQTLRYTRGGATRMRLPRGPHTIVVGTGDRVAERAIDVQSFQPTAVAIDLADSDGIVFKGCPPAVDPYLHGDMSAAARALQRDGHTRVAHLLLARLHAEQGHRDRAAENYEAAGRPLEAAALLAEIGEFARAATLYAQGGDERRAGEMFREAGEWQSAGESFESAQDWDSAVVCFREAGDLDRWIGVLERKGEHFEAAEVARESGDKGRSIRLLQRVGSGDPRYTEACRLLAEAFEAEGHTDLAAAKLEECIEAEGEDGDPALRSRLADLLDGAGQAERALQVLEALRGDHPTFPNVASRIEGLRKRRSHEGVAASASQSLQQTGPLAQTPTAFLEGNRYEILAELGRGGMGVVYRALDRRLNREVALKRLPENLQDHPKAIQLFLREAQSAARLNHRNIVTVYDTDQEGGNFFITMELLQGFPLNVIRKKKGRLAPRDVARIGAQVASGLAYAHGQRIIHRDIKTANLFFTTDKVVKIMDFGLAKMIEEVRKGATVIGGTPFYMAPEQGLGGHVDHRADIYALGITLFELSTGNVPFREGDVAYQHRHEDPPDPRSLADDLPDALAELILRMLVKDPAQRVGTAQEVEDRLRTLVG